MAIRSAKIRNKTFTLIFICIFVLLALSACGSETSLKSEDNTGSQEIVVSEASEPQSTKAEENKVNPELTMKINGKTVTV